MELPDISFEPHQEESSFQLKVEPGWSGTRLDQYLSQILTQFSRAQITAAIKQGTIEVDNQVRKGSYRLKSGEVVSGCVGLPGPVEIIPEAIDLEILFEDEYLLALSKPPGLVVHPGSGNASGTLVNGLVYYCQHIRKAGDQLRPGIVHRLDKDTSGVMVVAKTDEVHRLLVESFKHHTLEKEYIALVKGVLREKQGRIAEPIGRHPVSRQKMAVVPTSGKHAVTNWQTIKELAGRYSLMRLHIETGRTHQIRVHMAFLGHPVCGDLIYGRKDSDVNFPRQMLHAFRLTLTHPVSGAALCFTAPLWPDFSNILKQFDWQGEL